MITIAKLSFTTEIIRLEIQLLDGEKVEAIIQS